MAENTQAKERKLKIQPKLFSRVWKDAIFPEIRIAGKWLQDLGFTHGRHVTIIQQGNSLVITLLPEAKPQPAPELKEANPYRMLRKQAKDSADDDRLFVFKPSSPPPGDFPPSEKPLCQAAETPGQ